jgi:hypothetical protein
MTQRAGAPTRAGWLTWRRRLWVYPCLIVGSGVASAIVVLVQDHVRVVVR